MEPELVLMEQICFAACDTIARDSLPMGEGEGLLPPLSGLRGGEIILIAVFLPVPTVLSESSLLRFIFLVANGRELLFLLAGLWPSKKTISACVEVFCTVGLFRR